MMSQASLRGEGSIRPSNREGRVKRARILLTTAACLTMYAGTLAARQAPDGPQNDAPPAPAATKSTRPQAGSGEQIIVPSGTRIGVTLENGISTATAKPGDSV